MLPLPVLPLPVLPLPVLPLPVLPLPVLPLPPPISSKILSTSSRSSRISSRMSAVTR